jgi:NAD+ kinase
MNNIGVNVNSTKDKDGRITNSIIEILSKNFPESQVYRFKDSIGLDSEQVRNLDIVISLGGDGTILRSARAVAKYDIPILGVNIGNLGFLAGVECQSFEEAINNLKCGKYNIEERVMLQCTVKGKEDGIIYNSLNDIVISKGTLSRIVRYDVNVDSKFYTSFTADGVIISTPTGSTAYSLSAGGPIIFPNLRLIEITPICPHTPGMRSLVLNSDSQVDIGITKGNESVFLTVDGQESLEISEDSVVNISSSKYKCRIVQFEGYDYFEVLRRKIIWRTIECER